MNKGQEPIIAVLEAAARALGPLCEDLVFLGGCAMSLLITDSAAPPIRVSGDVDTITRVASMTEYLELGKKLRARGFDVDYSPGAPVCRWLGHGIVLDAMPTDASILGFTNPWFEEAFATSLDTDLPGGARIRLIEPVHFIATKLAAFDDRGAGDYMLSHDLEDIVCVFDGRPELSDEILQAPLALRRYLGRQIGTLLADSRFREALSGHLPGDSGSQARLPNLLAQLERLAETGAGEPIVGAASSRDPG